MTPEQRKKLVEGYLPYLDNHCPKQGKKRDEMEQAIMVGALAYATALETQEVFLTLLLMSGRLLTEEVK
jgi:hypothetical protein